MLLHEPSFTMGDPVSEPTRYNGGVPHVPSYKIQWGGPPHVPSYKTQWGVPVFHIILLDTIGAPITYNGGSPFSVL